MRTPKAHYLCELIYTAMWEDVSPHENFLLPLMLYIIYTSGVLEHKWRASLKLHYC